MPGLCVNPCATSLALYLTTTLLSSLFRTNTHLYPTGNTLGGVRATGPNNCLLESERNSISIASFHLTQSERFRHSAMDFGLGSSLIASMILETKLMSTFVFFLLYSSPDLA